ncbi:DUF2989 domain-containing protein [Ferrimonas balearica]|uniref:DUF2989 domain-containing protein n=1 Tax=Ferrimonas balearica TaxID=44012 RepID=UPI001C57339C|nr:DUF2989 domain-containing protein [Ferrimonas balearica]MBW3163339.1 DUF2989 domain-containing protein [Ferrimonas balearica]
MKTLPIFALLAIAGLSGCDRGPNVRSICEQQPALCNDLNTAGWCRHNRANIIHARHQFEMTGDASHRFDELVELEGYVDCMNNVSQMVGKTSGGALEQERSHYFLKGLAALEALQQATQKDPHPSLSLYHWTRFNDDIALNRFLEAEAQGELEGVRLKRLAGLFFSERDPAKAKRYLLEVVEANPMAARVDSELLMQLGYVLNTLKQSESAFLFTYLGQQGEHRAPPEALAEHLGLPAQKAPALVERADALAKEMSQGKLPLQRFNL